MIVFEIIKIVLLLVCSIGIITILSICRETFSLLLSLRNGEKYKTFAENIRLTEALKFQEKEKQKKIRKDSGDNKKKKVVKGKVTVKVSGV